MHSRKQGLRRANALGLMGMFEGPFNEYPSAEMGGLLSLLYQDKYCVGKLPSAQTIPHIVFSTDTVYKSLDEIANVFSCPGSSIPDLGD